MSQGDYPAQLDLWRGERERERMLQHRLEQEAIQRRAQEQVRDYYRDRDERKQRLAPLYEAQATRAYVDEGGLVIVVPEGTVRVPAGLHKALATLIAMLELARLAPSVDP